VGWARGLALLLCTLGLLAGTNAVQKGGSDLDTAVLWPESTGDVGGHRAAALSAANAREKSIKGAEMKKESQRETLEKAMGKEDWVNMKGVTEKEDMKGQQIFEHEKACIQDPVNCGQGSTAVEDKEESAGKRQMPAAANTEEAPSQESAPVPSPAAEEVSEQEKAEESEQEQLKYLENKAEKDAQAASKLRAEEARAEASGAKASESKEQLKQEHKARQASELTAKRSLQNEMEGKQKYKDEQLEKAMGQYEQPEEHIANNARAEDLLDQMRDSISKIKALKLDATSLRRDVAAGSTGSTAMKRALARRVRDAREAISENKIRIKRLKLEAKKAAQVEERQKLHATQVNNVEMTANASRDERERIFGKRREFDKRSAIILLRHKRMKLSQQLNRANKQLEFEEQRLMQTLRSEAGLALVLEHPEAAQQAATHDYEVRAGQLHGPLSPTLEKATGDSPPDLEWDSKRQRWVPEAVTTMPNKPQASGPAPSHAHDHDHDQKAAADAKEADALKAAEKEEAEAHQAAVDAEKEFHDQKLVPESDEDLTTVHVHKDTRNPKMENLNSKLRKKYHNLSPSVERRVKRKNEETAQEGGVKLFEKEKLALDARQKAEQATTKLKKLESGHSAYAQESDEAKAKRVRREHTKSLSTQASP